MKLIKLIYLFSFIACASAKYSFYPYITGSKEVDYFFIRKLSSDEPYVLGGTEGKEIQFTINDDGTVQDSDGDFLGYNLFSKEQYLIPTKNTTRIANFTTDSVDELEGDYSMIACGRKDGTYYIGNTYSNCTGYNSYTYNQTSGNFDLPDGAFFTPNGDSYGRRIYVSIATDLLPEKYENSPKFTLRANISNGDNVLKIGKLFPYAYSIGGEGEVANFTLLPGGVLKDQKDVSAINLYGLFGRPLGRYDREKGTFQFFRLDSTSENLVTTSYSDPWYLCYNNSIGYSSARAKCNATHDFAKYPAPSFVLQMVKEGEGESTTTNEVTYKQGYELALKKGLSGMPAYAYAYAYSSGANQGSVAFDSDQKYAEALAGSFAATFHSEDPYAYAKVYAQAYAECGYVEPPNYDSTTFTVSGIPKSTGIIMYKTANSTTTTYVPYPRNTYWTEVYADRTKSYSTTVWPVWDTTRAYFPSMPTGHHTVELYGEDAKMTASVTSSTSTRNNAAEKIAPLGALAAALAIVLM